MANQIYRVLELIRLAEGLKGWLNIDIKDPNTNDGLLTIVIKDECNNNYTKTNNPNRRKLTTEFRESKNKHNKVKEVK